MAEQGVVPPTAATSPGFSTSALDGSQAAPTAATTPHYNPLASSSPTHYTHSPFFQHQQPMYQPPPPPSGPISLDTLAQQIYSLSTCVMSLTNKVNDNNRLFEENFRLKDIVIDLEYKLREANDRVKSVEVLRESMTSQFAELNETITRISGGGSFAIGGELEEGGLEGQTTQTNEILDCTIPEDEIPDPSQLIPEPGDLLKLVLKLQLIFS